MTPAAAGRERPSPTSALCAVAREVDEALARMDGRIDWLTRLTPVNIDEIAAAFEGSGYRHMPDSRYGEGLTRDAPVLRRELFALPVRDIANPVVEALMLEKQRELDRQIELVRMRDCDGFIMASIDLFGPVDERLLDTAHEILANVPIRPADPHDVDAKEFHRAATGVVAAYRAAQPRFACEVMIDSAPGTAIFASRGNLHIAYDYMTSQHRVQPLLAHEIGTHALTRHNGRRQPLHTLAGGLADYDQLQEGIAVLAEYLAGYLPADRLRLLAARVIATHMAVEGRSGPDIYACLVEEHHTPPDAAFDTAVRAKRGGGLTKDALYLKGLEELLAYLHHGGEFEILFVGKFALKQLHALRNLLGAGIVQPPEMLPAYLQSDAARQRLARVRNLPLAQLYQESPEA